MSEAALRDPDIPDGERTAYRGSIRGSEVGIGTLAVERADDAYLQRLEMTIEKEARYSLEMTFLRRRGTILSDHYRLETFHGDAPVAVEEGWFRDVRTLQWGGELEPYPRSVLPLLGCAVGLRGLEFEKGARRTISLWLANSVHWEIELRVERLESVNGVDAWRVRARPSFEAVARQLDRIIGIFLPPFVLHFEREPSHRFIRFEFPTGPFPWNPRGLIEAELR